MISDSNVYTWEPVWGPMKAWPGTGTAGIEREKGSTNGGAHQPTLFGKITALLQSTLLRTSESSKVMEIMGKTSKDCVILNLPSS